MHFLYDGGLSAQTVAFRAARKHVVTKQAPSLPWVGKPPICQANGDRGGLAKPLARTQPGLSKTIRGRVHRILAFIPQDVGQSAR
jgi:hypothetical protein